MTTVIEEPDDATGEPFEDFTKAIKATAAHEDYEFSDEVITKINCYLNTYNNALAEQCDASADKEARKHLETIKTALTNAVTAFKAVNTNPYFRASILDALEPTGTNDAQIDTRIDDYNACVANLHQLHDVIVRANSLKPTSDRIMRATRGRTPDVNASAYGRLLLQLQPVVTETIEQNLKRDLAEKRKEVAKFKAEGSEDDAKDAESEVKKMQATLATLINAAGSMLVAEVIEDLIGVVLKRWRSKTIQNQLSDLAGTPPFVGLNFQEFTRTERDKETGAPPGTYLRVGNQPKA